MNSTAPQPQSIRWLAENGPKQLESLFRAIVFHPSAPILIADDDRRYHEASIGASELLGLPREKIIGRRLDDFAAPAIKPVISERWRAFLEIGQQAGTLQLLGWDGTPRDVEYTAKGNVLPVRHLLLLRDKTNPAGNPHPSWVQDYALFLLNVDGQIVAWYAGAERIYGFESGEAMGQHLSVLYSGEDAFGKLQEQLTRALAEGHVGDEGWHVRKNGSRFWANVITMALKDENGDLQGFAGVVRDFTDRHERDEKLRNSRGRARGVAGKSTVAGVVSGEFDRIPEANDTFLELVGYSRKDLLAWPAGVARSHAERIRGRGRICTRGRFAFRGLHALRKGVAQEGWDSGPRRGNHGRPQIIPFSLDHVHHRPAGARPAGEDRRGSGRSPAQL